MYNPSSSNLHLIDLRTEAEARAGMPMRIRSGFSEQMPAPSSTKAAGVKMHSRPDTATVALQTKTH